MDVHNVPCWGMSIRVGVALAVQRDYIATQGNRLLAGVTGMRERTRFSYRHSLNRAQCEATGDR